MLERSCRLSGEREGEGVEAWERSPETFPRTYLLQTKTGDSRQVENGSTGGEYELQRLDQWSQTTSNGETRASLRQLC